ncbi:putative metallo-hydrolase [Planctomycetes bacterium Pan216]|uniref:Putative metallo-hydrolase n=1 Tax=Kolteria novifilia TaxID=2527975 RepID=A0A518B697_9BACT|nr:putative metallo-hydrolase [Planctomycetes bacterium Pan216]
MPESLQIECFVSPPFGENAYVLTGRTEGKCVVVDPSFETRALLQWIDEHQLTVEAIWNTHGHVDHIAGNASLKEAFPSAPLIIGEGDAVMLTDAMANLSGLAGAEITSPPQNKTVAHGEKLTALGYEWEVREIPGHSPGHVVFVCVETTPPIVIGGDVLFQNGIGRYDFPGGDGLLLRKGIREKLYSLADATIVYPGHGPTTTIGHEKRSNPFTF